MRSLDVAMNNATYNNLLSSFSSMEHPCHGKQVHALAVKEGFEDDRYIKATLITMLFAPGKRQGSSVEVLEQEQGKRWDGLFHLHEQCGAVSDYKRVFASMDALDLISWNSVIAGSAKHDYGGEAIELFVQMKGANFMPDRNTFSSVLATCSHSGLLEKGIECFHSMNDRNSEHYARVVDLLGKAGYLDEVEAFVRALPIKPELSVYRALMSASRVHGNVEMAKRAAQGVLEVSPIDPSAHVLLANTVAAAGCWDKAAKLWKLMNGKGLTKKPAWREKIYMGSVSYKSQ
ncbi:pentatricopeptide repeat-containing protein [Canna indica]|uniref:Pentatricopeptide repeat-containing protein n=1 Tax=Canna indica TaxID=4628 RepID=A0AAQ3QF50_9LILI|nr:pentatricopeptide repeat-containing protein [Canna indica]